MEDIIKRIIDIDTMERKMLVGERDRRVGAESEITKAREAIRDKYAAQSDAILDTLKKEEEARVEGNLKAKAGEIEARIGELNSFYTRNKDTWVENIYKRVIG